MLWILITLLVGAFGGFVFLRIKIPAGAVIGAMIFVIILSALTGKSYIPNSMILFSRMIVGTILGCRISLSNIKSLKNIFAPILFFTFFIIFLSMIAGLIIFRVSDLDQATAFFGSSPGGLADMSLISAEFGANMSKVAILQFVRIIACMVVIPFLVTKNLRGKVGQDQKREVNIKEDFTSHNKNGNLRTQITHFVIAVIIGLIGGTLGLLLSIPSGALIGAFILVTAFNIFCFRLYIPLKIRRGIQVLLGSVIGSGMTLQDVLGLKNIVIPATMVAIFLLIIGFLMGISLNKIWHIDLNTAIIATAPGGLTEMSLIAPEFGADLSIVMSLHFVRMISIIIIYPLVIKLII